MVLFANLHKNKIGSFSMLFVILLFVIVISVDFFVNYLIYNAMKEELYGIINNSADSSLRYAVDNVSHRQNELNVSSYNLRNKFNDLVLLSIKETNHVHLNSVRNIGLDVRQDGAIGFGSNQDRQQLKAVFFVEIDAPRLFSLTNRRTITFEVEKRIVFSSSSA